MTTNRQRKLYTKMLNSQRWRELRLQVLAAHPICEECEHQGRVKAARCVHHRQPVESARTDLEAERLCFDRQNLQALCFECHSEIHRAERSHSKEAVMKRQQQRTDRLLERLGIKKAGP